MSLRVLNSFLTWILDSCAVLDLRVFHFFTYYESDKYSILII